MQDYALMSGGRGFLMLKLTVYIPETHIDAVKSALFAAGAGRYSGYDSCSWQVRGEGQFRPLDGSSPFTGSHGVIEHVAEYRVEMICDEEVKRDVRDALIQAHPYEVPAYDFTQLMDV